MKIVFYDVFSELCEEKGISCKRAAIEIGLSNSIAAKWKRTGATPNGETLNKIAAYFGVSVGYLLGKENKNAPALTKRDERDIAATMEQLISQLADGEDLMFDGDPMSDEARSSMLSAMRLGLEAAKIKNKERFTPKKYRKG